jgi:hypothetical protein
VHLCITKKNQNQNPVPKEKPKPNPNPKTEKPIRIQILSRRPRAAEASAEAKETKKNQIYPIPEKSDRRLTLWKTRINLPPERIIPARKCRDFFVVVQALWTMVHGLPKSLT